MENDENLINQRGAEAQGHQVARISSPSVEFDQVSVTINGRRVLKDVCLRLAGGQTVAVMGPRGCGKTVLAATLAGRVRPSTGRVLIGGESIWGEAPEEFIKQLKATGVLFGANSTFDDKLDRSRTVLDNLTIPLRETQDSDEATRTARQWAAEWDLDKVLDQVAEDIDTIARHRLCLAQTMVADPPMVIVDDPSAAVDLNHIMAEIASIKRWQRRTGGTIFLTTHSLGLARGLADHVAILRDGQIIAYGTTREVLGEVHDDAAFEDKFGCLLSYRESDPERLKALGTDEARTQRNPTWYVDISQRSNSLSYNEEDVRPRSVYDKDVEAQYILGGRSARPSGGRRMAWRRRSRSRA